MFLFDSRSHTWLLAVFPQVCVKICAFQQSWVQLRTVMCKCSRTVVQENVCICSETAWRGSRSNIDLAVATAVPASLPEGSFGLGELWGRSSILLFQSCLLLKAHLLRVFQRGTWLCFYMGCWILADVFQLTMVGFSMQKLTTAHTGGLQPTRESELLLLGEVLHSHPVEVKQLNQMIFARISFLDFFLAWKKEATITQWFQALFSSL